MVKTKTSSAVKDRWNKKAYDELKLRVPKGQKETIQAAAEKRNMSVNAMINQLIFDELQRLGFENVEDSE